MKDITCIEDLRELHRRRTPKAFFDYVDHGSYTEQTLHANMDDLQKIKFRQRILVDISERVQKTTILGEPANMPLILAPVGSTGMQIGDGEILACRAAQAAGIPYTLSTMSICSIEQVAANVEKPFWFQLYMMKDRGFCRSLIERAIAAKCSALVLTVDLQILGQRHMDIKNGLSVPPNLMRLKNIIDFASKPRWLYSIARAKSRDFGNIVGHLKGANDLNSTAQRVSVNFDPSLNWKDVEWIRSIWPGKIVLKGIHDVEDAKQAVKTGAHGIVVSNHGGRNLDTVPATIEVLPAIAARVNGRIPLLMDGGVRRGTDVVKALALGASAVMIGRPFAWALAVSGADGVTQVLKILREELETAMALLGRPTIASLRSDVIW